MIIFENQGEIDPAAICTFGVSVKDGENPIGFFGTGLKYALAILLRTGHEVTIWSGERRMEFSTETTSIRGQDFELVAMNGERMGFTTEVGKTWELWMAYRELFCNARDEGGEAYRANSEPCAATDRTFVAVKGDAFEAVHAERWRYFVEDEPDIELDHIQVWRRQSDSFFYRGVRVHQWPRPALLTYNDTLKLDLTEDRTAKSAYEVPYRVARALLTLKDEDLLRTILTAGKEWMEHHFDFHGWGAAPSAEFLKTVGQLVNDGVTDCNATARKVWREAQPNEFKPREIDLTAVQRKSLDRALDFCGKIGFPVRDAYPVTVVESLGVETLGLASQGRIFISERAFHLGGSKQVASTLIEEYIHLRHGYVDCTRQMQNWLFEKMVSLGEEVVGEPL